MDVFHLVEAFSIAANIMEKNGFFAFDYDVKQELNSAFTEAYDAADEK